ncbi:MAG: hypothetical protein GY762_21885 [Proteobacteria bacterium]|nr:hypothetical protein [Pseudomonadota bacterium]
MADEDARPAVLAAVTTPTGKAREADIARTLVPETSNKRYRLVHIDALVDKQIKSANLEMENRAKRISEQAKEASLNFNLVQAAGLRRQAADTLLSSETVALKPSLVATYVLEAGAASAEAGETDLAILYFRRALAVDGNIRPGASISPQAKQLFDTALANGPLTFKIPHKGILQQLCGVLAVDGILWIAVGHDEEGIIVSEKLLLANDQTNEPETRHRPPYSEHDLAQWIPTEKKRIDTVIAMRFPKKVKKQKPWYKQWWVYTIAGGVLVATAVGVGLGVGLREKEADVTVHY